MQREHYDDNIFNKPHSRVEEKQLFRDEEFNEEVKFIALWKSGVFFFSWEEGNLQVNP